MCDDSRLSFILHRCSAIGNQSLEEKNSMEALGHRYYRSLGALCRNRRIRGIDDLIGWAMLPGPLAFSHVIYFGPQYQKIWNAMWSAIDQWGERIHTDHIINCNIPHNDARFQIISLLIQCKDRSSFGVK